MNKLLIAALSAFVTISAASAATPPAPRAEQDAQAAPRRGHRLPALPNMPDALNSPSNADVGDGDSFGRNVKYLGFATPEGVLAWHDCTGWAPERCAQVTDPTLITSISYIGDEAVIKLPARAARSLLCFNLTSLGQVVFHNPTTTRRQAHASLRALWRIESEVLNDPSLINPVTGEPFGGFIESGANMMFDSRGLDPADGATVVPSHTRTCIAGHLSRRSLLEQGLSEEQAREVFRKPITLRFGAGVSVSSANAYSAYGVRVYGD